MSNTYFQFKQFRIEQKLAGMKVTTDGCLFGGIVASNIQKSEPSTILDIGTGTGLLGLMLAQATIKSQIHGVEINPDAAEETKRNYSSSPWNNRLVSMPIDVRDHNPKTSYNLIICNPPFFDQSVKGQNSNKNQAIHSDHLSMVDLAKIIEGHLSEDGMFWVMYPEIEMKRFIEIMESNGFSRSKEIQIRDMVGSQILRTICEFNRSESEPEQKEIIIKNEGDYTKDFKQLLREYYLYLD